MHSLRLVVAGAEVQAAGARGAVVRAAGAQVEAVQVAETQAAGIWAAEAQVETVQVAEVEVEVEAVQAAEAQAAGDPVRRRRLEAPPGVEVEAPGQARIGDGGGYSAKRPMRKKDAFKCARGREARPARRMRIGSRNWFPQGERHRRRSEDLASRAPARQGACDETEHQANRTSVTTIRRSGDTGRPPIGPDVEQIVRRPHVLS